MIGCAATAEDTATRTTKINHVISRQLAVNGGHSVFKTNAIQMSENVGAKEKAAQTFKKPRVKALINLNGRRRKGPTTRLCS